VSKATKKSAEPFVPDTRDLGQLHDAAASCRGCDLYARATQVVFGEGPKRTRIVLIGEQPGDVEDVRGRPFVGPAGGVLDRALEAAGLGRKSVYMTNAVKHFSFEERGKRRIHKKPRVSEMRACRPWLEAELQAIRPACVVCMGSTAAQSLLGPDVRIMQVRGQVLKDTTWAPAVVVTIHPSAVLRADDGEELFRMLVADLKVAKKAGQKPS
jgi:uracil-DNA glycosylase family protein